MRFQKCQSVHHLSLSVLLTFLLGCGSRPASSEQTTSAATIVSCVADAECQGNTFCDQGQCASPGQATYGAECVIPEADPATGKPRPADFMCGAYVCSANRCRSCDSDDQCSDVLGSPACKAVAGLPGKQCGDYSGDGSPPEGASPPVGTSSPPAH